MAQQVVKGQRCAPGICSSLHHYRKGSYDKANLSFIPFVLTHSSLTLFVLDSLITNIVQTQHPLLYVSLFLTINVRTSVLN